MELKEVTAKNIASDNVWNFRIGYKKFAVVCGECGHDWGPIVKIHPHVQIGKALCPECNVLNCWNNKAFAKALMDVQIIREMAKPKYFS